MGNGELDALKSSGYSEFSFVRDAKLNEGLNLIQQNGQPFYYFHEDCGSDHTMVSFSAAAPIRENPTPIFSGRRIASRLGMNYLGFADSAQLNPVRLSTFWHLGTEHVDSPSIIPRIIGMLSMDQRRVFFGASAGGFAALKYSAQSAGSKAFVMNPRINLMHEPRVYRDHAAKAFPKADRTELARSLGYDMASLYGEPRGNTVTYLQNTGDQVYLRHHYAHFAKATEGRGDVRFVLDDWGRGHVVPPSTVILGELKKTINSR